MSSAWSPMVSPSSRASSGESSSSESSSEHDETQNLDPFASDYEEEAFTRPLYRPYAEENDEDDDENETSDRSNSGTSSDASSEAPWSPPDPDEEFSQQENVERLRAFQGMTTNAQIRVVFLHQHRGYTIIDAIDAVMVETRRQLLTRPVVERQSYTTRIRLHLGQINEAIYEQWNILNVLIEALPPRQREVGQRVMRLTSEDPRDFKCLYEARCLAESGLGIAAIDHLLADMNANASSFRRYDHELHSLRQYNRHRPPPDPPAVEPLDDWHVPDPTEMIGTQNNISRAIVEMEGYLRDFQQFMRQWLMEIFEHQACYPSTSEGKEPPKLHGLQGWDFEVVFPQIREAIGDASWDDPAVSNSNNITCILFGTFSASCSGMNGRVYCHEVDRMFQWDQWHCPRPHFEAVDIMHALYTLYQEGCILSWAMKETLKEELGALSKTMYVDDLLHALSEPDDIFLEVFRRRATRNFPPIVQERIYSYSKLLGVGAILCRLHQSSSVLVHCFVAALRHMPRLEEDEQKDVTFPVVGRGARRARLISEITTFHHALVDQIEELRPMVQSCQHVHARDAMLAALPPAGQRANLQRVRDVAVAARVEASIRESADMMALRSKDSDAVYELIARVERNHMVQLVLFEDAQLPDLLRGLLAKTPRQPCDNLKALVPKKLLAATFGRHTIGPAVRHILSSPTTTITATSIFASPSAASNDPNNASKSKHNDDDDDSSSTTSTSTTTPPSPPTTALHTLLHASLHPPTHRTLTLLTHPTLWFSPPDTLTLTRLLLRAHYLAREAPPTTPHALASALTRHAWTHALLNAWLAWHLRLRCLLYPVYERLVVGDGGDAQTACAWAIAGWRDWGRVGGLLGQGGLGLGLDERRVGAVVRHFGVLGKLRAVSGMLMGAPDGVDWGVLPGWVEGLGIGEGVVEELPEEYARMHMLVRFEGCVLDGGRMVVRGV